MPKSQPDVGLPLAILTCLARRPHTIAELTAETRAVSRDLNEALRNLFARNKVDFESGGDFRSAFRNPSLLIRLGPRRAILVPPTPDDYGDEPPPPASYHSEAFFQPPKSS